MLLFDVRLFVWTAEGGRDFCLHEAFNATCRSGSVIKMISAAYGRMRLGRCINGDFNIGCSKDVVAYMDAQCTARSACEVSVRNLVDIHPCQRDFMSYLEASYKCIDGKYTSELSVGLSVCLFGSRSLVRAPTIVVTMETYPQPTNC